MSLGRRESHLSTALVLALLFVVAPAAAQEGDAAEGEPQETAETGDLSFDDWMGEDDLLRPEGYTYDAGGRRDPFRSLLAARSGQVARGPRPEGIPGLLIDEIDITGIFILNEGAVAQIRSTQQEQSFLLREGDQLFDGDVLRISETEIVFKQIVDDPTAIKPFREVVKGLEIEGSQ